MQKITKLIIRISVVFVFLFTTTAFVISDNKADFEKQNLNLDYEIYLSEIETENTEVGTFKSSFKFNQNKFEGSTNEFYGQKIIILDNPQIDKILIGVTNNLLSRVEIWNQDKLIDKKEIGFVSKMTWGDVQTMSVAFYDQTNKKHSGKSKISMQFFNGTGFFGDIGIIHFDLTNYGDLSGSKTIALFANSDDSNVVNEPEFSELRIWKNYMSYD